MKEELKKIFLRMEKDLGARHPDTIRAKKLYETYCFAEEDVREKAIKVYENELREIIAILNKIGKDLFNIEEMGEIISFEGSVKDFRKAMEASV